MNIEQAPANEPQIEFPPIKEKWLELKRRGIKQFPQNNLRASSLGFPCDRYHYHSIKDWRMVVLHDEIMQSIFDEGKRHETWIIQDLQDMGFEIIHTQRPLQIDKPLVTGSIDGILRYKEHDFPFDAKTMTFDDGSESMEDMLYSKKLWVRSYPGQLQLYLLMTGQEYGCFIMKEKGTGELKVIWGQLDYDYCEKLLKRAERVYAALEKEEPPAKINDFNVCEKCKFRHVCLPDIQLGEGIAIMENKALLDCLDTWWNLRDDAKAWGKIDKAIKNACKATETTGEKIIGDYLLKISSYTMNKKVPITYETKETTVFKTQITKLEVPEGG